MQKASASVGKLSAGGGYPDSTLKILQLLLRCGMICREELDIVLEMIPEHCPVTGKLPGIAVSRVRQSALLFDFD
jgi:hypothetical protein